MKTSLSSVLLVLALGFTFVRLSVAANSNGTSPQECLQTQILLAPKFCRAFDVEFSQTGDCKEIDLPGDHVIFTSPGLDATLTNLTDPSLQVTLSITGAFHQTTEQNGNVVTVSTGRSLLFDPEAGFVLAIGHFSYVFDAAQNLVQPLKGEGQLIDVCALIE